MDDKPRVALFVTCLVDQALPEIGVSTVKLLRQAGYAVDFPPDQVCCGQPFFNSGLRKEARRLAKRAIEIFADAQVVVLPSGSCTTMIRQEYPHLFEDDPPLKEAAEKLAAKTFELSEFLDKEAPDNPTIQAMLQGRAEGETITYHDSCHMCRMLGLQDEPRRLMQMAGMEIAEMAEVRCCGFGGVFSVRMPEVSNAMTAEKLRQARETGAKKLITADPGCLMQMQGMLRDDDELQIEHIAIVLERAAK